MSISSGRLPRRKISKSTKKLVGLTNWEHLNMSTHATKSKKMGDTTKILSFLPSRPPKDATPPGKGINGRITFVRYHSLQVAK